MKSEEVIETIESAIIYVKNQNQDTVKIDVLLEFLKSLKSDITDSQEIDRHKLEIDLAIFRAKQEDKLAQYDWEKSSSLEMFRSVISYEQDTL